MSGVHSDPEHAAEGAGCGEVDSPDLGMAGGDLAEEPLEGGHAIRVHLAEECQGDVPALRGCPPHVRGGWWSLLRIPDPVDRPGEVGDRRRSGPESHEQAHVPRVGRESPVGRWAGAAYHGGITEQRG